MAAPDDDIMADIINAGTNVDVDDTSQYFASACSFLKSSSR